MILLNRCLVSARNGEYFGVNQPAEIPEAGFFSCIIPVKPAGGVLLIGRKLSGAKASHECCSVGLA